MLAGLLFATHEATDRPGTPIAALPFGAATLLEYQARLLVDCGADQIVVVVARPTPGVIGAVARIAQRGITIDMVRRASEAVAKLHPLAQLLVLADGLVTTPSIVQRLERGGGESLLVCDVAQAPDTYERVGGGAAWAGIARVEARRVAEAATMPADWDLQSTLLHAAVQAGAVHVAPPPGETLDGHGIERSAAGVERRGRDALSLSLAGGGSWFDRWLVRPLARLAAPAVVRRGWRTAAIVGAGGLLGVMGLGLGLAASATWGLSAGLLLALLATLVLGLGQRIAAARDQPVARRRAATLTGIVALSGFVLAGWRTDMTTGGSSGLLLAIVAIVAGGIALRAAEGTAPKLWWADASALLCVLAVFCAAGLPLAGLAAGAAYATGTLAAAVETLRRRQA